MIRYSFQWQPEQAEAVYTILLAMLAVMVYWFIDQSGSLLAHFKKSLGSRTRRLRHVFVRRLVSSFFFGVLPLLVLMGTQDYTMADYGWSFHFTAFDLYWTLGLSAVMIFLSAYSARKPVSLARYPEIRARQWPPSLLLQSNLSWVLYLLA